MRFFFPALAFASVTLVGGCGLTNTNLATAPAAAPDWPSIVGMIQTNYPTVRAEAEKYKALPNANPSIVAKINKVEAEADPLVPALSATSAPTTIQTAANDLAVLVATPIGASIPSDTKADIGFGLSLVSSVLQMAPLIAPLL